MLNLHLVAIGGRMPNWVTEGCDEYRRRIRGRMTLNLVEVPAVKRGKNVNPARIAMVEERRLTAAVPGGCRLIALDRQGREMSTMDIVRRLEDWLDNGEQAALVVGGPEGCPGTFSPRQTNAGRCRRSRWPIRWYGWCSQSRSTAAGRYWKVCPITAELNSCPGLR